jgi:hypothetical protein
LSPNLVQADIAYGHKHVIFLRRTVCAYLIEGKYRQTHKSIFPEMRAIGGEGGNPARTVMRKVIAGQLGQFPHAEDD